MMTPRQPNFFASEAELDEFMSSPDAQLIADLEKLDGDIMIVGAGGKMGPTVARMAKRAAPDRRVFGVARFSEPKLKAYLESHGIETISADLLDRQQVAALPRAKNIIFMAGRKFGSSGSEELTWAMNSHVPALVAEHFAGSRIVVYSTICVYPFAPVAHGGSREEDPVSPPGEYAMSCVARERIFQHFSKTLDTPALLFRLSYAIDMRYGVLHDLALKVLAGQEIDVSMGHVNVIWQGDACSQSLRSLLHTSVPAQPLNVSGPETVSIAWLAREFGRRFECGVKLVGEEAPTAWLANTSRASSLFGYPTVALATLIDWQADWLRRGLGSLNKATHFEVRTGTY
ncbi:NAD-dependent epimerase/dehydratase family protein [Devosia sp. 1566]|uniref:NAD-dependent epimerase/dehydratase family protein n=1 Tax=Devosia sp. 1566 TaxID=2499144 RepID=UPI000FD6E34B|nr:NAD-dependent epimerase/dehydratase family protein [Devosia sp. 1566]